jgi:hypothetical protein
MEDSALAVQAAAVAAAAAAVLPPTKEDCDAIQRTYKACAALQYDRWLHPKRHGDVAPDYEECVDSFAG